MSVVMSVGTQKRYPYSNLSSGGPSCGLCKLAWFLSAGLLLCRVEINVSTFDFGTLETRKAPMGAPDFPK